MQFEPRTYRRQVNPDALVTCEVVQAETDLQVSAACDCAAPAHDVVRELRGALERYIGTRPRFAESFVPVAVEDDAPEIVRAMASAASAAGVGPMAAVAGAVAERVAKRLLAYSADVIVENGGDIYLVGTQERRVLLVAGSSPLSGRVAIALGEGDLPAAVCTSSGIIGHSVSLGIAHAATVVASDGALCDAVATGLGNRVHGPDDIEDALAYAHSVPGVRGAVVIVGDRIGAIGEVRLVPVEGPGADGPGNDDNGKAC